MIECEFAQHYLGLHGFKKASEHQIELLNSILSIEVAIITLRNTAGICDSHTDNLVSVRRDKIDIYDLNYPNYIRLNNL